MYSVHINNPDDNTLVILLYQRKNLWMVTTNLLFEGTTHPGRRVRVGSAGLLDMARHFEWIWRRKVPWIFIQKNLSSIKTKRRVMCDPCTKHNTVHTQRSPKSEVKPNRDSLCNIERGDVCFQKNEIYELKQTSDGAKQLNLQIWKSKMFRNINFL